MDLAGKTAIVTGGARRLGREIALDLAGCGVNVVINYRRSAGAAAQTVAELSALGVGALAVQADVGDYQQVQGMVEAAVERFGGIDILVNNAAPFLTHTVPTDDLSAWHESINTMVHGPFYCANLVAPVMLERGGGVIIGIGDLSGEEAWAGYTGHAVGKGAVLSLTRQLALELAPTIRANAVIPGLALPVDGDTPEANRAAAMTTLLERWGTPAEMAHAVRFLIEADYITGETIVVDGGQRFGHRKHAHG